jgi:hypothetical protein
MPTSGRRVRAPSLNCERALQERFRLAVAVLGIIQRGEVVERCADVGVVGSMHVLYNCKGALQERRQSKSLKPQQTNIASD